MSGMEVGGGPGTVSGMSKVVGVMSDVDMFYETGCIVD